MLPNSKPRRWRNLNERGQLVSTVHFTNAYLQCRYSFTIKSKSITWRYHSYELWQCNACSQRNCNANNLMAHEVAHRPASTFDPNVELALICVVIWPTCGTRDDFLSNFRYVEPPYLVHHCVSGFFCLWWPSLFTKLPLRIHNWKWANWIHWHQKCILRHQNHYSMTSTSQNIKWIVNAKITPFALDDPIVHYACGFWAIDCVFCQCKWLFCVYKQILELLYAFCIRKNLSFAFFK